MAHEELHQELASLRTLVARQERIRLAHRSLTQALFNDLSIDDTVRAITSQLTRHLDLLYVGVYLKHQNAFDFIGGDRISHPGKSFRPGQGFLGESVVTERPVILKGIPESAVVECGSLKIRPGCLVACPVFHSRSVLAVLELGGFREPDAEYWEFLNLALGDIGMALKLALEFEEKQRHLLALKAAKAEADDDLQRLSTVFKDASLPIIIEDLSGIVIDMNPEAESSYGWSREELLGKPIKTIVPRERHTQADQHLARCRRGKRVRNVEGLRQRRTGEIVPVLLTLSLLKGDDGKPTSIASFATDISDLKRAEAQLQGHQNQLERRVRDRTSELESALRELEVARAEADQANQAKSLFLANMSHEVRTPMNAVLGLAHLCLQTELSARSRDYVEKIERSAQALLRIVNDILDFSKIEAGMLHLEATDFELKEVIARQRDLFEFAAQEKGLRLEFTVNSDVPPIVRGDPHRLGQVITNLLANAVKFTEQGEVQLKVSCVSEPEDSPLYRFEVFDTGPGVNNDKVHKLFESFSQADSSVTRRFGGTGLGLAICYQLVELMGGNIGAESRPEGGSRFWFDVPLQARPERRVPRAGEKGPKAPPGDFLAGKRVLVAEDNAINLEIVRELLDQVGAEVAEARTGLEAVDWVKNSAFDAILMDLQMPQLDGLSATRAIRDLGLELPIIALSANVSQGDRERCLAAGMSAVLGKPLRPELLYQTLSRWLVPSKHKYGRRSEDLAVSLSDTDEGSTVWDRISGLRTVNGNRRLYERLLTEFLEQTSTRLKELAWTSAAEVGLLAHTIAGTAGNLGLPRIRETALRLERAVDSGEPVATGLSSLRVEVDAAVRLLLPARTEIEDGPHRPPGIGDFKSLELALRLGDVEALELISRVEPPPRLRRDWEQIRRLILEYQFEQALSLLNPQV